MVQSNFDVVDCPVISSKRIMMWMVEFATISAQLRSGHSSPRRRNLLFVEVPPSSRLNLPFVKRGMAVEL